MKDNYIRLSWESSELITLPVSSSIVFQGSKYSLLTDYIPNEVEEGKYVYEPLFRSENMLLSKKIFIYKDVDKTPETEWSLTADIDTFAKVVVDAIKYTTDRDVTVSIDANIAGIKSIDFSNTDILSGLNKIVDEYETEWWFNGDVLNISKCEWGDTIELKVGDNINAPRIDRKQEQITRFIAFGSDRNITQDYKPSTNLVNYKNRLTLPKDKYPNGYIDIKDDLSIEEILPKVFVFDNIYPSSKLTISNVKSVLKYVYDTEGNKVEIGKDEEGNPLYDTYFVFTFEIPDFDFDVDSIIPNEELKGSFTSGKLIGMTFLLAYKDGVYTIKPNQENLPNVYYNPEDGDGVILINIDMPKEYVNSAERELEQAVLKEIEKTKQDYNTYSFNTDRTANQDDVLAGRKVKYINKGYELETRIISVEAKLDNYNDKSVIIGNDTIKSPFEELREDIYDASRNIDVVKALNEATSTIQNSMIQGQREFLENLEKWGKLWTLRKDGETIHTVFDAFVQGGITMYSDDLSEASPSMFDAFPHDGKTIKRRSDGVYYAVGGGNGGTGLSEITIKVNDVEYETEDGFVQLPNYPTKTSDLTNDIGFTTEKWVNNQGFLKEHQDLSEYSTKKWVNDRGYLVNSDLKDYATQSWSNSRFALKSHKHNWSDINNTPTTIEDYGITNGMRYVGNTDVDRLDSNSYSYGGISLNYPSWGSAISFGRGNQFNQLHLDITSNKAWTRGYNNGVYSNWARLAYLDDNVASATKLQAPRKIWGQSFDGTKNISGDFINGDGIISFNKHWNFNKDIVSQGGITMYGTKGASLPTLFDSFPHDNVTIKRRADGVYYAVGGAGGMSKVSISVNDKEYFPDSNGKITIPNYPNRLSHLTNDVGYTTEQWVESQGFLKEHQDLSLYATRTWVQEQGYLTKHQDLSGYALKSHRHNWSDIDNTPTSIDGYGITDGVCNLGLNPTLPSKSSMSYVYSANGNRYSGGLISVEYNGLGYYISGGNLNQGLSYKGLNESEWRDIAFLDSNVVSATKLQNTRRIFGQQFNGTQDVRGNVSDIIDISMTGKLDGVTKIILKGGKEVYYDSARGGVVINDNLSINDLKLNGGVYNADVLNFASSVSITDGFGGNILETLETGSGTTLSLMEESLMLNIDGALLNGKFYLNGCLIECIDGVFYLHGDVVSTGAMTMFSKK